MAPLGNLVRLLPLHINELPAHPALESLVNTPSEQAKSANPHSPQASKVDSSERPNLFSFMEEVLDQATLFIDDTLPTTFKEGGLKNSAPAVAKVRLLSRNISMAEIQAIPWINSGMKTPIESLPHFELQGSVSGANMFELPPVSFLGFSLKEVKLNVENMQAFREIGQMERNPPKHGLLEGVAMPITVAKGLQTLMSSTSVYGSTIQSVNSK